VLQQEQRGKIPISMKHPLYACYGAIAACKANRSASFVSDI